MGGYTGLADARAFIARRLLKSDALSASTRIGSITLRAHQRSAVTRLRSALDEFGGALLCDQVGTGKTFVALALCDGDEACVVAPAVLREMWHGAAQSTGKQIEFISTESLSRATRTQPATRRILIVDEAHHFRNPRTKRYVALAKLLALTPTILLTATPVHNRKKDLASLLALFLGSSAEALTQSELGRLIVRRETESVTASAAIPELAAPVWYDLKHDDDLPRLLLDLPPPLMPRDGGDGGALLIHSLVRQWSSSVAALEHALKRRLQRSFALVAALEGGTYPSRSELAAWAAADDCVQLAFAELVATKANSTEQLLAVVRHHRDAISDLLRVIDSRSGIDSERADIIRTIRKRHVGISVVAFSQYADTVHSLFRELSRDGGVAALTGDGARVSGGKISRREAIGRFAPVASGVRQPGPANVVTLLLTTDLLSEGVNLQDAAVVIHLDLPWTPARMEQRLGRVARMGSRHERVFSYVIRPPASTETLIHLERVLHDKVKESSQIVDVFPSLSLTGVDQTPGNTPRLSELIRSTLEKWSNHRSAAKPDEPCFAAVASEADGFLALCASDNALRLVASDGNCVSDNPRCVISVMQRCSGPESPIDQSSIDPSIIAIERYFEALRITDGTRATSAHAKRDGLKRIAKAVSRARPHDRARVVALASAARSALMSRVGADGEKRLALTSRQPITDDQWMSAVADIGSTTADPIPVKVIAVIQLVADTKGKQ